MSAKASIPMKQPEQLARQLVMVSPIYVELETAAQLTTLSPATIQKLVTLEKFPAPRLISGRRVAYLYSEIADWANQRPVSNLPPPANTGAKKDRSDVAVTPEPACNV